MAAVFCQCDIHQAVKAHVEAVEVDASLQEAAEAKAILLVHTVQHGAELVDTGERGAFGDEALNEVEVIVFLRLQIQIFLLDNAQLFHRVHQLPGRGRKIKPELAPALCPVLPTEVHAHHLTQASSLPSAVEAAFGAGSG